MKVLSKRNKNHISLDRQLELVHFCRQYKDWVEERNNLSFFPEFGGVIVLDNNRNTKFATEDYSEKLLYLEDKIRLVDECLREVDPYGVLRLRDAVVDSISYDKINARYDIPCSRTTFYRLYRKFFYILSERRG